MHSLPFRIQSVQGSLPHLLFLFPQAALPGDAAMSISRQIASAADRLVLADDTRPTLWPTGLF